jgi:hypothetical protein
LLAQVDSVCSASGLAAAQRFLDSLDTAHECADAGN